MSGVIDIALERDGHDQPWGFRLQGGHDVGMPLSIQRALCGTPSEGVLKKGDVLLKIGKTDAKSLSHQQAADLFTNTGNQIVIQIKRSGVTTSTTTSKPVAPPQPVPVAGGVALPGMTSFSQGRSQDTLLLNLPKTRGATKPQPSSTQHSTTAPLSLTIQNQPYRTSPLIQPSAKTEVGPGSATHLKMQADYLTGAKEAVDHKPSEYTMKHKVAGTLQNLQSTPPLSGDTMFKPQFPSAAPSSHDNSGPSKQVYNNPIGLYSSENVAEVTKMNKMGLSALPASPTGLLHPNKIQQVVLTPAKDYNPKDSATWQALQESDPTITDPEKLKNYTSLREHDPIFSEVYSAQKHKSTSPQPIPPKARESNLNPMSSSSAPGQPVPSSLQAQAPARSPVADLLPPKFGGKAEPKPEVTSSEEQQQSAVLAAALAESKPIDPNADAYDMEGLPLFETNSIGGRKKIAQSASFNKLMMNVLGD